MDTQTIQCEGRKKDQLDSKIIQYVKRKCEREKKDREDCIDSIDEKARDLKGPLLMKKLGT